MAIDLKVISEGDDFFYYIKIKDGDSYRTPSYEEMPCYIVDKKISQVSLDKIDSTLKSQIAKLFKNTDLFKYDEISSKIIFTNSKDGTESKCMVNIDLDKDGIILGIEII